MASALTGSATTKPILIQCAMVTVSTCDKAITASSSAAAGKLPAASLSTIGQSIWSDRWCRQPPTVLVIEA